MEQLVKTLRTSTFVRHNAIFFVGSLAIGLLNYLYYPILGRLLHPDNFGEVQVLFSLFAQISIFLSVLGLITVNIVTNYEDISKRNRLVLELEKLALLISLVLLVLTMVAGTTLQTFFHFTSALPFTILMLAVVVSVPLMFRSGFLRGLKKFGLVSVIGVVAAGGDLLLSAAFVLAGGHTAAAIAALVVAQLIAFAYAASCAHRLGFTESLHTRMFRLPDFKLIKPELKYALLVLVGSLTITAFYTIDAVAVKHYFDAHTAGVYAGISTVARIIFFLTASIVGVLLPSIRLQHSANENQQILIKSFALLAGIGGAALIVFTVVPRLVVHILMGKAYLPDAHLLPRLSLMMFIVSLLNLFIMYHIALRRYSIMAIVIIGMITTFALLATHHQTIQTVINSLLFGSLTMFALLGIWLGVSKFNIVGNARRV